MSRLEGQTIGPYRLLATLGRGGMGVVYRARDLELDRDVALKVLAEPLASQPEYVERLLREARAAAAVDHPGIVHIYRAGEADDSVYIAMQLVEGQTLSEVLRDEGALPWPLALRIVREAAKALHAAHRHGLVHRDIKSDNIMLQNEDPEAVAAQSATVELDDDLQPKDAVPADRPIDLSSALVKLMDFGLARSAAGGRITRDGSYLGTPEYSSPEQCETGDLDGRSDLYSLGVVLYECLTGRLPHRADTPLALFDRIRREEPVPPSKVAGCEQRIPAAVEALCLRLLAKRPADRPATAGELVELIDRVLLGEPLARPATAVAPSAHPVTSRLVKTGGLGRGGLWLPLAKRGGAALVLLAAVLAVWRPWSAGPEPWTGRPRVAVADFENRAGNPELDWLRIGAPDLLITALSQVQDLDVISRDDARQLYETPGRVDFRVEGEVFQQGQEVRLNIRVQDLRARTVKLAEKFQGRLDEGLFVMLDQASVWLSNGIAGLRPPRRPDLMPVTAESTAAGPSAPGGGGAWADLLALAQTAEGDVGVPDLIPPASKPAASPIIPVDPADDPRADTRDKDADVPLAAPVQSAPPAPPASRGRKADLAVETEEKPKQATVDIVRLDRADAGNAAPLPASPGAPAPMAGERPAPAPEVEASAEADSDAVAGLKEESREEGRRAARLPLPQAVQQFYCLQTEHEGGRISDAQFVVGLRDLLSRQPKLEHVSGVCAACKKFPEVRRP